MKNAKETALKLIEESQKEEHLFHGGKSMIISYLLPNGFTIDGRAGLVNINDFDLTIGQKVCKEDAVKQLTTILAYHD